MNVYVIQNRETGKLLNKAYTEARYARIARTNMIWTPILSTEEKEKRGKEKFAIFEISGPLKEID